MLQHLQQQLRDIYHNDAGYDVRDFLVTDARVARALSDGDPLTVSGESLLLSEDEDGLAVSLYLDSKVLDRLGCDDPAAALKAGLLDDLCKVIEGLSHFDFVAWRAWRNQPLSLLELELQAEIDKFISTLQLARDERDVELMNDLHGRLFSAVQYHDWLTQEQVERYRTANQYAARFCRGLKQRLLHSDDTTRAELRSFYRMPLADKISHIHARAWD